MFQHTPLNNQYFFFFFIEVQDIQVLDAQQKEEFTFFSILTVDLIWKVKNKGILQNEQHNLDHLLWELNCDVCNHSPIMMSHLGTHQVKTEVKWSRSKQGFLKIIVMQQLETTIFLQQQSLEMQKVNVFCNSQNQPLQSLNLKKQKLLGGLL